jgi:hypothetical protein
MSSTRDAPAPLRPPQTRFAKDKRSVSGEAERSSRFTQPLIWLLKRLHRFLKRRNLGCDCFMLCPQRLNSTQFRFNALLSST